MQNDINNKNRFKDPRYVKKITNEYNILMRGIEIGKEHKEPSRETKQFIKIMEQKFDGLRGSFIDFKNEIKEKLDNMPTNDGMKLFVKDIVSQAVEACNNRFADKELEAEVKNLDCKFASKEIEKTIKTISNILLTATIGGAIALTYKIIEYLFKF